ncbi:MAG: hypothetical protein HY514_03625 [Candidatus Aenigmarchaeota archaeon]|nr:hypothetical protein [Candidatus Aenigmarchaeota archaeon]
MSSKDIRNVIITLIILASGVKILLYITEKFVNINAAGELGKSFSGMGTLFMYGAIVIAIILVPFYLSARSDERKKNNLKKL